MLRGGRFQYIDNWKINIRWMPESRCICPFSRWFLRSAKDWFQNANVDFAPEMFFVLFRTGSTRYIRFHMANHRVNWDFGDAYMYVYSCKYIDRRIAYVCICTHIAMDSPDWRKEFPNFLTFWNLWSTLGVAVSHLWSRGPVTESTKPWEGSTAGGGPWVVGHRYPGSGSGGGFKYLEGFKYPHSQKLSIYFPKNQADSWEWYGIPPIAYIMMINIQHLWYSLYLAAIYMLDYSKIVRSSQQNGVGNKNWWTTCGTETNIHHRRLSYKQKHLTFH